MEIQISRSLSLNKITLFLVLVLFGGGRAFAQVSVGVSNTSQSLPEILSWKGDISGAIYFLHEVFPDIDARSKMVVVSNRDWADSPTGTGDFTIYICEPDFPSRAAELRNNFFSRFDIQCSTLSLFATFQMAGSPLGPLPREITIGRPDLDKRWAELESLLRAHPEWSQSQVEDAMKASGVKYGAGSHNEFLGLFLEFVKKSEPFFGKLQVDSMEYDPPYLGDKGNTTPPGWRVEARPSRPDKGKSAVKYILEFSAFDGSFESEFRLIESGSSVRSPPTANPE